MRTHRDALKQRYEGAVLEAMSLPELRQLRGNITGWLQQWPESDGAADLRPVLKAVEIEISWRARETVGV